MVQFLHCPLSTWNPYSERFPYRTCFSRFDLALPFLRTAAISGPRRRRPLIGQRFVVPHYSQPTPNQWPKNLRSQDLPTQILPASGSGQNLEAKTRIFFDFGGGDFSQFTDFVKFGGKCGFLREISFSFLRLL